MRKLFPLLFGILLIARIVFAQSQASTGNIEGRVIDPQGAAVPNVAVTARNQDTGFEKTVNSNEDGTYTIVLLPSGNYRVTTAALQGFGATTYENVPVTVGGKTALEISLSVGTGTTVVDVRAEGEIVETTRTSVSSTVEQRSIVNLPVNGRNFLDFATLTPGVIRDPTRAGDLAISGQKGTLNSIQIDGADNNNTFFGQSLGRTGTRPPYQFSIESVKEFQINQNGFSAEFGRAGGAVINVVTRSGTNEFRGGVFEFFRDESLNSNTPILMARGHRDRLRKSINSAEDSAVRLSKIVRFSFSSMTVNAQTYHKLLTRQTSLPRQLPREICCFRDSILIKSGPIKTFFFSKLILPSTRQVSFRFGLTSKILPDEITKTAAL